MDVELKRRDRNLGHALKQRDEEWREKLDIRERELRGELKAREKAFVSYQLKRDNELLKIVKERERMQWRRISEGN